MNLLTIILQAPPDSLNLDSLLNSMGTGVSMFANAINWLYVITLSLIARAIIPDYLVAKTVKNKKVKNAMMAIPTSWRVIILGIVYAVLFLYLNDDLRNKKEIQNILHSLAFTMVFYKILIKQFLDYLAAFLSRITKIFPSSNKE